MKSYVICSTQRSGSTYFCESIIQTKQFGTPKESLLYHEISDVNRLSLLNIECKELSFPKALEVLKKASSTSNNVCGIKVMMSTLERILRDHNLSILKAQSIYNSFNNNYSSPLFVFWKRSNKIKQAISHAYLRKTRMAHAKTHEEVQLIAKMKESINLTMDEIYYDFKYIVAGEAKWKLFFIQNEITPFILEFENFLQDKKRTFNNLSKRLGFNYNHLVHHNNDPIKKISSDDQKRLENDFANFLIDKHDTRLLLEYDFDINKHY